MRPALWPEGRKARFWEQRDPGPWRSPRSSLGPKFLVIRSVIKREDSVRTREPAGAPTEAATLGGCISSLGFKADVLGAFRFLIKLWIFGLMKLKQSILFQTHLCCNIRNRNESKQQTFIFRHLLSSPASQCLFLIYSVYVFMYSVYAWSPTINRFESFNF